MTEGCTSLEPGCDDVVEEHICLEVYPRRPFNSVTFADGKKRGAVAAPLTINVVSFLLTEMPVEYVEMSSRSAAIARRMLR